ncbi:MAG: DUF6176 family protein [Gammaproteobacteria bacterium]|nr:DUF6176 family protein [Gammaproteobacteria bacterium]
MKTELSTFLVRQGKEVRAREWMAVLVSRQAACVDTLAREKMVIESVFMLEQAGRLYLTWYSVQKPGHETPVSSGHDVDREHVSFWQECVEEEVADYQHAVSFVPGELNKAMDKLYT